MGTLGHEEDINKELSDNYLKFLTFTIESLGYAIDVMAVQEIRGWSEVTRLPNAPESVRGVINLRGTIIPIFDMRISFKIATATITAKHIVIIVTIGEKTVGMLVDSVSELLDVEQSQIQLVLDNEIAINEKYTKGLIIVNSEPVVILDLEKLFTNQVL